MDEDLFHVPEPERPVDLATGDGTYRRKARLRTMARPVHPALVVVAGLSLAAAIVVATEWYTTGPRSQPDTTEKVQVQPGEPPRVVIDNPGSIPVTAPLCEYRTPDRQSIAELPARVDKVPGHTPRLVLQTNQGRIVVLLNGWAGHCAVDSTVSQALAGRYTGLRCAPFAKAKALRCKLSTGYVYRPQLIDLMNISQQEITSVVDKDGTIHIVLPDEKPEPEPVGKRGGLLTIVAGKDGYAGGDLVLAYADTTLPAGAFYPTVGEVDEGAEVLSRIGSGLTITGATVA